MGAIVLLARKLDQGGTERQLITLAKALRSKGRDVHVVLFYAGGVLEHELVVAKVPAHHAGKSGRWDALGFLIRLVLTLRALRPDTIYSFLDMPNVLAAMICRIVGRPKLVWSVRSAGMEMRHYDWLSRLVPAVETALSAFADKVIANSHAGKEWAVRRGFMADKIVVVENGIDTDSYRFDPSGRARVRAEWKLGDEDKAIGLVARLDVMKDHRNFLQACARLTESRNNLRFICIGGGTSAYRRELEAFAISLDIANRVVWAGPRSDMPAVLSAIDISCSSSFGEGFSNVIAESMACERPCVVTDVGDSGLIIGKLGELVPPRDSVTLAKGLARMLDRIDNDPELGLRCRARIVSEFSVECMVMQTDTILVAPL